LPSETMRAEAFSVIRLIQRNSSSVFTVYRRMGHHCHGGGAGTLIQHVQGTTAGTRSFARRNGMPYLRTPACMEVDSAQNGEGSEKPFFQSREQRAIAAILPRQRKRPVSSAAHIAVRAKYLEATPPEHAFLPPLFGRRHPATLAPNPPAAYPARARAIRAETRSDSLNPYRRQKECWPCTGISSQDFPRPARASSLHPRFARAMPARSVASVTPSGFRARDEIAGSVHRRSCGLAQKVPARKVVRCGQTIGATTAARTFRAHPGFPPRPNQFRQERRGASRKRTGAKHPRLISWKRRGVSSTCVSRE